MDSVSDLRAPQAKPYPLEPQGIEAFVGRLFVSYDPDGDRHNLLQLLIAIQQRYGWIPPQAVDLLGQRLSLAPGEIQGLIDFQGFLSARFQGQYRILLSSNITDWMSGQDEVRDAFCTQLGIAPGHVRPDGRVSLDLTSCTGLCDQGPAALINGTPVPQLDRAKAVRIARLIEAQVPLDQWPQDWFAIASRVEQRGWLLSPHRRGDALRAALTSDRQALLEQLEASGLRGRGGAGFVTYRKLWNESRRSAKNLHYLICNADEGEPGTFKDRVLLQDHADDIFDGMTLAAWTINARTGFLYLRAEYAYLLEPLQAVLQRRRRENLLGESILGQAGFDFDIQIHLGAGAYVCGEESALIESLEGRRGIPRIRPPYPDTHGYDGQPTLINNVETFCCLSQIARVGGAAFAAQGTPTSTGTKLHSVSGDCRRPGIYELPWGLSIAELLNRCGADNAAAVQVGGPSGTLLFPEEFHHRLDFADVPSGGSFMVFGDQRDLFDILHNFTAFFAHESCGFCTPCRAGTLQLEQISRRLCQGAIHGKDFERINDLATVMTAASHCGLGKTAARCLVHALQKRPLSFDQRRLDAGTAAFDVQAATALDRRQRATPKGTRHA